MLLILMLFISATFLRLNNIGMVQRRDAVIAADKQGEPNNTRNRVLDLQHYVARHMNTSPNDVYLEFQYERDRAAAVEQAATAENADNDVINQKVDAICKPQFSGYNQGYVDCFAREFAKYAPGQDPVSTVKLPDPDRYRFVFASPYWSPDFAGFSLLVSAGIILVICTRLISIWVLQAILKIKYRDI
jgi:hypothetical protein